MASKKNYLRGLEPGQVAALRDLTYSMQYSVPDPGNYQPYVSGGYFSEEDCRSYLREIATDDGALIRNAMRGYFEKRRWPRMKQSAKFFLEERLSEAARYCCDWLRSNKLPANLAASTLPLDASRFVELLTLDYWDDRGVDLWVRANLGYIDRPSDFYD